MKIVNRYTILRGFIYNCLSLENSSVLTEITNCRICRNDHLVSVVDLGIQSLTGVFPKSPTAPLSRGPLELVKCMPDGYREVCGLLQLKHSYNSHELYGANYGYRSGLNQSMITHLNGIAKAIQERVTFSGGDLVVDIGSNDGTLLRAFPLSREYQLIGVDPTGHKFRRFYPDDIVLIPDFFSADLIENRFPGRKARVITSIAMFYDLEDPMRFVDNIARLLHPEGIWVFEQSYLPSMLETTAYDTICHEHLEYFGLKQIQWMFDKCGLKVVDIDLNKSNGGSFRVTAAHRQSGFACNDQGIESMVAMESRLKLDEVNTYRLFALQIERRRGELVELLHRLKQEGKTVLGYGASTKGNVILQYCGIGPDLISAIAEVNEDKFGAFTPSTLIPIISEAEARKRKPDYFIVLPWHFREGIVQKEKPYLESGGKLIFPLPELEVFGL